VHIVASDGSFTSGSSKTNKIKQNMISAATYFISLAKEIDAFSPFLVAYIDT